MMSLRVHTDYDLENMEELQRVVGRRFARRQTVGKRIVFLTWGVCCEAVGLYLALYKDSVVLARVGCVLGCLMLGAGIFFYPMTAWTSLKAMGGNKGGTDFTLDKTGILTVWGKNGGHFTYEECTHLLETRRNFYLVTQKGQGLILDKTKVKGGSADDLRRALEERCEVKAQWVGKGPAPQRAG